MSKAKRMVRCETPAKGKATKSIPQWKYDVLRTAIRRVVPKNRTGIEFSKLFDLVAGELTAEERANLGWLPWHTTPVKLRLEVLGELERVPDSKPQRLRRVK